MIPKISNYKDLLVDHNLTPIFNDEHTMFDINYYGLEYSYPYLESVYDVIDRSFRFNELNLKLDPCMMRFIYNGEIIGKITLDDGYYTVLIKDDEVISYVRCDYHNNVLNYDCIPKYQRQGYTSTILKHLIRSKQIMISDATIDNKIILRNFIYPLKHIFKIDVIENQTLVSLPDQNKLLRYDDHYMNMTFLRRYSNKGIFAYSESYDKWFL